MVLAFLLSCSLLKLLLLLAATPIVWLQAVDKPTCFHCAQAPPISIRAYIQRIAKHSKCSPVCFIMAWSYLKRLAQVCLYMILAAMLCLLCM